MFLSDKSPNHKWAKSLVQSSLKREEGGGKIGGGKNEGSRKDRRGKQRRGKEKKTGSPNREIRNIVNEFIKPECWVGEMLFLGISASRQEEVHW